jgi:hypothetical protein
MSKKLIPGLLYIALILTPIFGLQEFVKVLSILSGTVNTEAEIFIKGTKDLLLLLIFLLFFVDVLSGSKFLNTPLVWLMITIILISFFITCLTLNPFLAVMGLRAFSPLLLIFIAYKYFDMNTIRTVVRILSFLILLEFCLAFAQSLYGLPIAGVTYWGLAARPFGTFIHPWSFAIFVCFVLCFKVGFDMYLYKGLTKTTWLFIGPSIFFIFLAGSGAGVITLSVLLISYFLFFSKVHRYIKASVLPALLLIPLWAFANLQFLTARRDIYTSVRGRMDILANLISSAGLKEIVIGKGLGVGSNAALTFLKLNPIELRGADVLFISDSLFASIIAQAGALLLLLFIAFNIYLFKKAADNKCQGINPIALLAIPSAMVASLGSNVIELFPVNWLLFVVYGLALKRQKRIAPCQSSIISKNNVQRSPSTRRDG